MDTWIGRFRAATPVPGEKVLIPGDPERAMHQERLENGIPVIAPVVKDMQDVAAKFKLNF
jgi:LDH2 family malate/lactate/ureidoglycolate dehydrogenase